MTVAELIAELEKYNRGAEVRLAFQPNWPLAFGLGDVLDNEELVDHYHDADTDTADAEDDIREDVVWLTAGDAADDPYADKLLFNENRW